MKSEKLKSMNFFIISDKMRYKFMLGLAKVFESVGLISTNDYENFKFNLPFIAQGRGV